MPALMVRQHVQFRFVLFSNMACKLSCLLLLIPLLLAEESDQIYVSNSSGQVPSETNPAIWTESDGLWGSVLEEYVIGSSRHGRIMPIPLVVEDNNLPTAPNATNSSEAAAVQEEKEAKVSNGLKILVSNSSNNMMRKPMPQTRPVTENDLYLLNAMEKLVYKMDFMEKRLKRVEEMMYYMMAGNRIDNVGQCPDHFVRAGMNCYLFGSAAGRELDWKAASKMCKKHDATLAELESIEESQDVVAYIQKSEQLRGKDFWTGGLNPGLLWIWSNSARPVKTPGVGTRKEVQIVGDGRCLRLAYNPGLRTYAYRGTDCGIRYSYICEKPESMAANELRRLGRSRKIIDEEN